jgi:hypothetical protein
LYSGQQCQCSLVSFDKCIQNQLVSKYNEAKTLFACLFVILAK